MCPRHLLPPGLLIAFLAVSIVTGQEDPTSSYPAQLANPYLLAKQREAAALWLAALKDRSNLDLLIQVLPDPDEEVRRAVILALERIGDPAAVPALIGRLLDGDCHSALTRALGRLDPSWRQRPEARALFESLVQGFPASLKWSLPGRERPPWFALQPMTELDSDAAADFFTQILSSGGPPDQFIAGEMIDYLEKRKWTAAEPALLSCLENRKGVVFHAAEALSALNPRWRLSDLAVGIAGRLLERYRQMPNRETRDHLYEVLARISLPEALPILTRDLFPPGEASEQRYALRAVGQIGTPQALAVLGTYFADSRVDKEMARECLLEIADFRSEEARDILLQVLRDPHREDELRELAARRLLDFGQVRDVEAVIEEATARRDSQSLKIDLLGALVTGTKNVARGRFAGEVIDDVELTLVQGKSCVRKLERQACDANEGPEVRKNSLDVLRGIQDPSSFTPLLSIATDKTAGELRESAIRAMASMDKSRAAHLFWRLLEERSSNLPIVFMAWTLTREGEQATRRLADRFGDVPDVQETLAREGRVSLLPKEKAIAAIRRLLSRPEGEYFSEILIRQWLELAGDGALAELSQNESAAVRAWASYAGFRREAEGALIGKEKEIQP